MVKRLPDKKGTKGYLHTMPVPVRLLLSAALLFMLSFPATAVSQSNPVSVEIKSGALSQALTQLKDAAGVHILFNEDIMDGVTTKTTVVDGVSVEEALAIILADTGFGYQNVNDTYVISKGQQSVRVTGVVTSDDGAPLAGVTVANLEAGGGVATGIDGSYTIEVRMGQRLRFSFIGYENHEVTITQSVLSGGNRLDVTLMSQSTQIEKVAVIGYGTTQKIKDATGTISHIDEKDLQNAPMASTVQSVLQGRAAGVNVQVQSASPTSPISVIIRGQSSLSGNNQPLWVIDGIPEYNTALTGANSSSLSGSVSNILYSLNLNDVSSIDILKDASATAIYGSRAAHGVIVVTTKSGLAGRKPTIEFSSRIGFTQMDFNDYDYFTAEDYKKFTRAAVRKEFLNRGTMDYFTRMYLDEAQFFSMNTSEVDPWAVNDLAGAYYDEDNYWMGLATQNPINQQYNLSLRGGTDRLSYSASAYANLVDGIVKTGFSNLYGGSLRLEAKITDNLKMRAYGSGSTRKTQDKDNMLDVLKKCRPDLPMYNEDGSIFTRDAYTANPLTIMKNTNNGTSEEFKANLALDYQIIDGLTFTTEGYISYANRETLVYNRAGSTFTTVSERTWSHSKSDTKSWINRLMYANTFGKHDIMASVNVEMEGWQSTYHSMGASGFPDDEILNSFSNATTKGTMTETYYEKRMLSYIGRAQYNYDSRYLLTLTFRRDGSSLFGSNSRWGNFPSIGVGWTFSNESFIRDSKVGQFLSHGKLRASYGKAGSQNLSTYQWMTMVSSNIYNGASGIYPANIGNPSLQWEETRMLDIGLELEFFESRLRLVLGYFEKKGDNLIYTQSLPPSSAFSTMTANMASTKARGFEFDISYDVYRTSDWLVTLNANGSQNNTWITKFNNSLETYHPSYSKIEVGGKVGQWWGYETMSRLFATHEELMALRPRSETGEILNYRNSRESVGDLYVKDQNGDGIVDSNDATYLGSWLPKLFGGFGVTARYRDFMAGANFTYSWGNKRFWSMPASDVGYTGNYNQSNKIAGMSAILNDPYLASTLPNATPYGDGGNGTVYDASNNSLVMDYWLYDASYIRLSSLFASYRFGKKYFGNTGIDNIEISLSADNLFTLTKYPGFDPQGNFSGSTGLTGNMGVDQSYYPASRTYTIGLKITF